MDRRITAARWRWAFSDDLPAIQEQVATEAACIVLAVILGLLIPLLVASRIIFREWHHALDERRAADHRQLAEIISLGMQKPLWNLSQDVAYPLFASVLSDERVTAVIVRDK